MKAAAAAALFLILLSFSRFPVSAYEFNNEFMRDPFPKKVSERIFSIPLGPSSPVVIVPSGLEAKIEKFRGLIRAKCGVTLTFFGADRVNEKDLAGRDLIILGNIADNRWTLELYKRRYAFSDAYFPGKNGVVIHPAPSLWDTERRAMVIGYSGAGDGPAAFAEFAGKLEKGAQALPAIRFLKTSLAFPQPPEEVSTILKTARENPQTSMAPYATIANWGLCYHLTGNRKWAEHFMSGIELCYERAARSGQWIPEHWTNVYFCLWKMIYAWDLIDEDAAFTPADRKRVAELLWGYTRFCDWLPNLDPALAPPDEPRQNHTTFLALSLYQAHRYFVRKYGIRGLDSLERKFRLAFDRGEAASSRPNDDAGGYLVLAPMHLLIYQMAENNRSFLESGKLRRLADLAAACIDNRNDPASFGDVGGYSHREQGSPRGLEQIFFGMASWYYQDGQFQWLYNWNGHSDEKEKGGDFGFSLEELYCGSYAADIREEIPSRFTGVHPVLLDEGALRWSARRSEKNRYIPRRGESYLDKLCFRSGFRSEDEYLLLDGTSTFSHGHHDGNSVIRLTWKDRLWLFDSDYIKYPARYHNGVVVTRDGIQEDPPPLTLLDYAADFAGSGFSRSTARDYNGADWSRTVVWRKGKYFLFLDEIRAGKAGEYRLESRWRTLGEEARLAENRFSSRQKEMTLFITSADDAPRTVDDEEGTVDFPFGNGRIAVEHGRKELAMAPNDAYTFASLVEVADARVEKPRAVFRAGDDAYRIGGDGDSDIVGLNPKLLEAAGILTDCRLFFVCPSGLELVQATRLQIGDLLLEAPSPVHLEIDIPKSTVTVIVPEGAGGLFRTRRIAVAGSPDGRVTLQPGVHTLSIAAPLTGLRQAVLRFVPAGRPILPASPSPATVDFGLGQPRKFWQENAISAFTSVAGCLWFATTDGTVHRLEQGRISTVARTSAGRPIRVLLATDINGDGVPEIIAGDDGENLFCLDAGGRTLWQRRLTKFRGPDANAVSLAAADIDDNGKRTVLVATNGWKLYALNPDGSSRWESQTFYHVQTKVAFLKNTGSPSFIAVGTAYHTPLNVLDPRTGKVLWFTWEEMGSEFISRTQYCGIHLTDMIFVDVNQDGVRDIVFGTKSNRIFALNLADGALLWDANAGDEVTAVREIRDAATGEPRILAVTEGGDIQKYDRNGLRLGFLSLGSPISGIEVIPFPTQKRNDLAVSTRDGRVIVADDSLLIRAAVKLGDKPIAGIVCRTEEDGRITLLTLSDREITEIPYSPYFLKKSRNY